ncbi:MAG: hypothetical protein IPJ46_21785 [Anaerolineales bacterium]|nr:hypothetical protein [Anaerolineales bacterium]
MKIHQRGWFYFLVILALIALDQFVFNFFFKLSYFEWYLKNGSLISIGAALVTFAWDVNKNPGLISANPRQYCGAYFQLIGAQLLAFGSSGKSNQRRQAEGDLRIIAAARFTSIHYFRHPDHLAFCTLDHHDRTHPIFFNFVSWRTRQNIFKLSH